MPATIEIIKILLVIIFLRSVTTSFTICGLTASNIELIFNLDKFNSEIFEKISKLKLEIIENKDDLNKELNYFVEKLDEIDVFENKLI